MALNPLASQCTARSKSNNMERCQHRVVGGGVCYVHGGNATQVKMAREARVIQMRAAIAAGELEPPKPRHPAEVLLSSIDGADRIMGQLRRDFELGRLTPELHRAYGEALDRSGRLSKLALDASATERWLQTQEGVARAQADQLIAAMDRLLADPRVQVEGDRGAVVLDAVRGLRVVGEGPAERLAIAR